MRLTKLASPPVAVAVSNLVEFVDVALRHDLVEVDVAVGDAVAEVGVVHTCARHRATKSPFLGGTSDGLRRVT